MTLLTRSLKPLSLAAALALARARAYDDGNSDIPDLEDRLARLKDSRSGAAA